MSEALALPCTAATSTMPARPAAAPPSAQARSTSRPTGSPASRAARALPPTMRSAKPDVVWRTRTYRSTQAISPKPSPQCTSRPRNRPIISASGSGAVEGLLRLAGSFSGPSTSWLNSAMAMYVSSRLAIVSLTPRQ